MKLNDQHYELVSVHDLTPHPKNPNRGNTEVIKESIAENGFFGAIVAQKSSGHILIGHHRLEAAKEQGAEQVPVLWLDVDDKRALKIMIADNRTAELAYRDSEALADLLSELNLDGGIAGTGYSDDDLDKLVSELGGPDADDWEKALEKVPSGERSPFTSPEFTLHDSQYEIVQRALEHAKAQGPFDEDLNQNATGNALTRVCETYLRLVGA